ncbi:MAG: hypothetical protein IJQ53_02100 [Clostridia bacterium]|nr:hypothetical protein [Clostridia bacterium]
MKRNTIRTWAFALLLCVAVSGFAGCRKNIPPAEMPSIKYDNIPLEILICTNESGREAGEGAAGLGSEPSEIPEIISLHLDRMPVNKISGGRITFFKGSNINVDYSMEFMGVYDINGAEECKASLPLAEGENLANGLPDGEHIICVRSVSKADGADEPQYRLLFARVVKNTVPDR